MILLSASSIKDYLACSARYKYRTTKSESYIPTKEMAMGTYIHDYISKYKVGDQMKFIEGNVLPAQYNINMEEKDIERINHCLYSFHYVYSDLVTDKDDVEKYFSTLLS